MYHKFPLNNFSNRADRLDIYCITITIYINLTSKSLFQIFANFNSSSSSSPSLSSSSDSSDSSEDSSENSSFKNEKDFIRMILILLNELKFLHEGKIIHRDIKTANIMFIEKENNLLS